MIVGDNYGVIEGEDYNPHDCKPKGEGDDHDQNEDSREDMDDENDTESNPGDETEKRIKI